MAKTQHFCSECGNRMWRRYYAINDKKYCNVCLQELFCVEIKDESEETNEVKDAED